MSASTMLQNGPDNARLRSMILMPCNACMGRLLRRLLRQGLVSGFNRKRQDQHAQHKGGGRPSNGCADGAVPMDRGCQQEVDPGADKASYRGVERKSRGADARRVLLGQP